MQQQYDLLTRWQHGRVGNGNSPSHPVRMCVPDVNIN